VTSTSPDEIRAEIEATREHLGQDLDELSERLSPHRVAGRTAENVRHKMSDAGNALRPKVMAVTDRARTSTQQAATVARRQLDAHPQVASAVQKTREGAQIAVRSGRSKAAGNPGAAKALAGGLAAVVLLLTLILRRRHHEVDVIDVVDTGHLGDPPADPA